MKTCFVISPIGEEGSKIRNNADQVLKHIIRPVMDQHGYKTTRADEETNPGIITKYILKQVIESDLVIADLSGHNPNVFYELGVRHVFGKPTIQLIEKNQKIPFDVSFMGTITYNLSVLDEVVQSKTKLSATIESMSEQIDNPVTEIMHTLRKSSVSFADFSELFNEISSISNSIININKKFDNITPELSKSVSENTKIGLDNLKKDLFTWLIDNSDKLPFNVTIEHKQIKRKR
ncbi:hypothetical protein H1S01_17060 [Heliobacterium chlorum]|uniref:Nucleoside 2-deoxyribosyltransferase n=1 Tax=Heliobacterium chlorum TaxID=2698 RepID=A0ABR7T7I7_HELCL|nr:hypothetical protein [Heliobacterium chlorum]MBC9786177.1 hypothetical protein [Heliobacterium chlorum]